LQSIADIKAIKAMACVKAVERNDRHSSARINVTDFDLKVLEDVMNGVAPLQEFWASINSINTDLNYMLDHADENLNQEDAERLKEIYKFLSTLTR